MGRILRFTRDRCQEARSLLPWWVTGQLEGEERARVEAHLRDCADCQAELRVERRLAAAVADLPFEADLGWTELRRRLDREPQRGAPLARLRRALAAPGRAGWALAAQFVMVIAAVGLVLPLTKPAPYHALGATRPASVGDVVVIFRPDARAEAVTRALRASGARLIDGPTAADAYVLDVPLATRSAALARLRADAAVVMAEPIDPAERP